MNIRRLGKQTVRQYGGDITKMLGGSLSGVKFVKDSSTGVAFADYGAKEIHWNPQWFKQQGRRNVQATLIHELAHLAGPERSYNSNRDWGENREEIRADAIRYALMGNAGITNKDEHWREAQDLARERGWADMAGPQLPGLGKTGGRMRGTLANIMSHNKTVAGNGFSARGGSAALPVMSPAEQAAYSAQMSALYQQFELARAQSKLQRTGLRAGLRTQVADIHAQKIAGLADTENAAIERGILGSSSDLTARAGVRADAAGAIAQAKSDMRLGIADSKLQDQQAAIGLYSGLAQLEAEKVASQQAQLAQQLQNNLIVSGQESTLDALKAMYRAWMQQGGGPGGTGPTPPGGDAGVYGHYRGGGRSPGEYYYGGRTR